MSNIDTKLSRDVARRYRERSTARRAQGERVERDGVLGAATPEQAGRRAQHAGRINEAIIGSDDSDSVSFLSRGLLAARAVCRLVQDGQPVGTGFLVGPGVLLTNNHVIGSADEAATFQAEFDYELDVKSQPRQPVVRFALDPKRLFHTSDQSHLDYTFCGVAPTAVSGQPLADFGFIPLDPVPDKILVGEPAVIVQHPRGEMKRVCLFASELVDKLPQYLHYTTDTDHGSSGSCVFNRSWQLVALHHASTPTGEKHRGLPSVVNEGIRVSVILEDVRGTQVDSTLGGGGGDPETSIKVRSPSPFPRDVPGYQPSFLGGPALALPKVPKALAADITLFDYTHYSVQFSKARRLPLVSAVNIDGAKSKSLARADRDWEAADRWYFDPRVPASDQLGAAVYDGTAFDFGHMTRREDPVWGDENTCRMANDDTFYMTNCAPQHHDLNTKTWLKLENAVLDAARKGKRKVSVFTGPVLSPQDPTVAGVKVPTAFWKIVAWMEGGELRAHGFMQLQTQLIAGMEALNGLEKAAEYEVPIAEITRATALDFGPLAEADELASMERLTDARVESLFASSDGVPVPMDAALGSSPTVTGILPPLADDMRDLKATLAHLQPLIDRLASMA